MLADSLTGDPPVTRRRIQAFWICEVVQETTFQAKIRFSGPRDLRSPSCRTAAAERFTQGPRLSPASRLLREAVDLGLARSLVCSGELSTSGFAGGRCQLLEVA